ncbi:MAG: phenylalanine--tRNA ligase subunit beta, partial [Akkermansiaceae bacterium]|nr:phenylalanine--tRNA ligase subunit beta [Armatimonadota bacterium]
ATELAPRFSLTVVRGVQVAPSPQWLQNRLIAAGMRPINNVVDITNYVLLETGQPLHAFDLATVPDGAIVVRAARPGEKLKTLDGVERALEAGMLCICDSEKPVGVAGVMGGAATEVTDATTDILLESAHFDPYSVRRTAKRLGLRTEASYRFERYVDPLLVPAAAERAVRLLVEIAGGTVEGERLDVVSKRFTPRRVVARVDRIRKLLGADVDRDSAIAGLERLGISVERAAGAIDCVIPAWRPDITREDDIAEEVGRIALGYANLPETLAPVRSGAGGDSPKGRFTTFVREAMIRAGLQDVHSHSLVTPSPLDLADAAKRMNIRLPLSVDLATMRTSLLPGLLKIVANAFAGDLKDAAVFEIGPVYHRELDGAFREPLRITGAVTGSAMPQAWAIKADVFPADFYFTKGVVEDLLRALGVADEVTFTPANLPNLHPGRTAQIALAGENIGYVAELSEIVVESHELPRRVYVFDLDGDALLARWSGNVASRYAPLPKYPSVTRDVAPVFDKSVSFAEIERVAKSAAGPLLERFSLTDVYEGANLGESKRSLTLRFTFRSAVGTLKDAEVESALASVRDALKAQAGAELRG